MITTSGSTADPGLRFWLRYVEGAGALCEATGDTTLALRPTALQQVFDLPEEVAVTADPDAAREDGALLLVAGPPALSAAAAAVLDEGDVGALALESPTGAAPTSAALLERARADLPVDHGRIDATGEAAAGFLTVLRVGRW